MDIQEENILSHGVSNSGTSTRKRVLYSISITITLFAVVVVILQMIKNYSK